MNIAKLNYHNLKYHLQFNIALKESYRQGFSNVNFYEYFNYDMKPNHLKKEEIDIINITRILAYKHLNFSSSKGLCTIITDILLEDLQDLLERESANITVGKIEDKNNTNLFNVPNKKDFFIKLLNDEIPKIGGNIHAWITLGDGTIIDPTIDFTLNNDDEDGVICGSPKIIYNKYGYKYSPYMVTKSAYTDFNIYNGLEQIEKLKYAEENIIKSIQLFYRTNNK